MSNEVYTISYRVYSPITHAIVLIRFTVDSLTTRDNIHEAIAVCESDEQVFNTLQHYKEKYEQ